MYFQNLAMIANFDVERIAIAVDVTLVEGEGSAELPGPQAVVALNHDIQRMLFLRQWHEIGSLAFPVGAFDEIAQAFGDFTVDSQMPSPDAVVAELGEAVLIIYR